MMPDAFQPVAELRPFTVQLPDELRNGLLGILQSAAEQENAHEADE